MSKVKMESKVMVPAQTLWQTIGNFNAMPVWHPAILKSESTGDEKGSTRTLTLAGGGSVVERLEAIDARERVYRYSILSGPLPVADYSAELRVRDNGDGSSTVEWASEFQPKGASEGDAVKAIQDVYQAGFDNLVKMFGMKK